MNNYYLLEQYRRKLSIYFTIFILLSIWLVVWFFEVSKYLTETNKDKKYLENKVAQITNIIKNKELYKEVEEFTFKKVLNKIFENSIIEDEGKILIAKIDYKKDEWEEEHKNEEIIYNKNNFATHDWYKYLKKSIFEHKNYTITVRKPIKFSWNYIFYEYLFLLLFSIPFSILFYFIWYIFVWKNLKPISETIKNLEEFTWNINHEFKTPLSEILSSLNLAKQTWDYEDAVKQSILSSKKLNNILDSLVWLINITDSSYKKQKTNLVSYSKQIVKNYLETINKKNINVNFHNISPIIIKKINRDHYHICFSNILSNAIKYSPKNSKIDITLNQNLLEIKDFWKWINKKNQKKVFERYFRESYINSGHWVWLSLVKKICDTNKWKIKIKSKINSGTKVTITIK